MAYTVTITKESVSKLSNTLLVLSISMAVSDEVGVVYETSMSDVYNSNSGSLEDFKDSIQDQLKSRWDKFKAENNILNSAPLNTAINEIQTAANAYVNM